MIDMLKQKAHGWALDVQKLYNTAAPTIELEKEKQDLIKRAVKIKASIEAVTGPLDVLAPMNFGFPPLVGAVGAAAVGAAMGLWYADYQKTMKKFELHTEIKNELIREGKTPAQAMIEAGKIVQGIDPDRKGLFGNLSGWLVPILGVGAVVYLARR